MRNVAIAVAIGVGFIACAVDDTPDTGTLESGLTCPPPTVPQGAVVETDPTVLASFTFGRVLDKILATAGTSTSTTRAQLWTQWVNTFANCTASADPHNYGFTCDTNTATTLGTFDVSNTPGARPHWQIAAAFNRFDLAPADGADCGEYRLVFGAVNSGKANLIFEGRLPNPTPASGIAGCIPVADFWQTLGHTTNLATRASMLDAFFFTGLTSGGVTFEPVVKASHYGWTTSSGSTVQVKGQIRSDLLLGNPWELREFKVAQGACVSSPTGLASCATLVKQVTVKVNPGPPLVLDPAGAGGNPLGGAFQSAFLSQISALSAGSAATISMTNADQFNAMDSVSQNSTAVIYSQHAWATFKASIAAQSGALSADNILDRATTQTCAGCHQLSNNACLGPGACGVQWPVSNGFTHVNLAGSTATLSPALLTVFLPFRESVMFKFLQAACNGTALSSGSANANLGGGPLDAPN